MTIDLERAPGLDHRQERRPFGDQPSELELVRSDALIEFAVGRPERLLDHLIELHETSLLECMFDTGQCDRPDICAAVHITTSSRRQVAVKRAGGGC
jgi:hypothetical protein